ncbi:DNA-3-methyladenine glycosylase [Candidatus Paracaedimonas acanthamoebae]|nr:DNA-3-methyladenine glycosylase [Candidatus Paracaedimonas acanthamoebae]
MERCVWAVKTSYEQDYHDDEWGVPQHDDRILYEFLILEMAQAGLNWRTILQKRENYRKAYHGFDPLKVVSFGAQEVEQMLLDPGLIRNRAKIEASIIAASIFLEIQKEHSSFSTYLWNFVDGKPIHNHWASLSEVPVTTPLSEQLSKDLKKRGIKFFGPTTAYAFLQAIGVVNDHVVTCFRHQELMKL